MEDNATANENEDEDDSDFELIEIFDLALLKTTPGTVSMDGKITFHITIINPVSYTHLTLPTIYSV